LCYTICTVTLRGAYATRYVHKVNGQDIEDAFLVYRWSQWQGANPDGLLLTKDELIEHLEGLGRDVDEYLPKIESL